VVLRQFDGPVDPGLQRMVGRLEAQDQQVRAIVDPGGRGGLAGVEQPGVLKGETDRSR